MVTAIQGFKRGPLQNFYFAAGPFDGLETGIKIQTGR